MHLSLEGWELTPRHCAVIASLPRLDSLDLTRASVDAEGMRMICTLPKLRRLELNDTNLNQDTIAHLATVSSLEELGFYSLRLEPRHLAPLRELPHLTTLTLSPHSTFAWFPQILDDVARIKSLKVLVVPDGLPHIASYLEQKRPDLVVETGSDYVSWPSKSFD
jgi:hypothetical protein